MALQNNEYIKPSSSSFPQLIKRIRGCKIAHVHTLLFFVRLWKVKFFIASTKRISNIINNGMPHVFVISLLRMTSDWIFWLEIKESEWVLFFQRKFTVVFVALIQMFGSSWHIYNCKMEFINVYSNTSNKSWNILSRSLWCWVEEIRYSLQTVQTFYLYITD